MCKSTLDARSVELYLTKETVPGVFRYLVTTTKCRFQRHLLDFGRSATWFSIQRKKQKAREGRAISL